MNIYSEIIAEQGFMTFSIKGSSMEPLLKNGDIVRISTVRSIKPGNCYMFKYLDKLILHRFVSVRAGYYFFIGDNCNSFEKVTREQICGVLNECQCRSMQMRLVRIVNRLYMIVVNHFATHRFTGLRKKIVRALFGSSL